MQILYFAWVRETIGRSGDSFDLPPEIERISEFLSWLSARGPEYAEAVADRDRIRVAVNQALASPDTRIANDDEVAIFPPMTGG